MKTKKTMYILLAVLLILVTLLAAVHFATRESVPEGAILVRQNDKDQYVSPDKLFQDQVTGAIVNGKGEEKSVDARGISLGELASGEYSVVTVTADDEYTAEVTAEEIENAFLILNDDGCVQLIVFGDPDSKRAVRNVVKVEFK